MAFNDFQITSNDVPTLQRFMQAVKSAFLTLDKPAALPVQVVRSSQTTSTYAVNPTDVFLVVDSRGGPIKIVLPAPSRQSQAVSIKNAYAGNPVSVVQSDGKAMGDGEASIGLPATEAIRMVNDGSAWWNYHGA